MILQVQLKKSEILKQIEFIIEKKWQYPPINILIFIYKFLTNF